MVKMQPPARFIPRRGFLFIAIDIVSRRTYNRDINVQTDAREDKSMEVVYNDTLYFEENPPAENMPGFTIVIPEHGYLRHQREGLGMTQQQVADAAGILLRQYQRLESGERSMSSTSLRIGLHVCDALKLDPHRFV